MRTLQVLITVVSILVTGVLLTRQLRRATKRIRLRPRLDLLRIVVQFGSVIAVAAILGAGAPIAALVLVGLFAVGPGYVQGRNLEISDDDGKLYAVRNTVAASVWGVGLVIMQFAGSAEADRHPRSRSGDSLGRRRVGRRVDGRTPRTTHRIPANSRTRRCPGLRHHRGAAGGGHVRGRTPSGGAGHRPVGSGRRAGQPRRRSGARAMAGHPRARRR